MKKYILIILAILLPIVIFLVYYFIYNISENNGLCSFKEITGLECPGCGGQRSIYYLLHGDILQALHYNAFFILAAPFLLYFYYLGVRVYILKQERYLKSFVFSSYFAYSLLISVVVFFILRNIPISPFTYLAPPQ
ncbi:MAG: DUF2752 domain-containing protein [Dysgonomonas sp.]|jgi:hypothetical protein|nr:DUF2752 domain-containing protein [Prevotella sp.]MDR3060154.1 DUF2752 domain-containing protein [Prevotella sp.]